MKKLVLLNTLALGLVFSPVIRAEESAAPAAEAKMEKKSDCEGECDCSKCKKGKDHKNCKNCKTKLDQKHDHKHHNHDEKEAHGEAPKTEAK
ncbi:MAG: hypothetical protein KGP28_13330 [Bdellovibrionales bacterium]|nr:hypothetical protein [Bdellovibrionales bacterium]